jgi:hypothetical protein
MNTCNSSIIEVEITLRMTFNQYVSVLSTLVGLSTRYYFLSGMLLSEICGLVSIRCPL